jgi:hypothetical protein
MSAQTALICSFARTAVLGAQRRRPAEGRTFSALLLAAHELRVVAEAAEARGDEAELAADLRALAHGAEQLKRNILGGFGRRRRPAARSRRCQSGAPTGSRLIGAASLVIRAEAAAGADRHLLGASATA